MTQHFLFHEMNLRLPRKFKIGVSGSPRDEAQVMINDIGLFAKVTDRGRGFAVYVAGGLGSYATTAAFAAEATALLLDPGTAIMPGVVTAEDLEPWSDRLTAGLERDGWRCTGLEPSAAEEVASWA